ncbi:MAG: hypothetical protein KJN71_10075, partial [Acidimicrobiia bacterium]|nr:hypothetical protein [Acidimicrobiia bacterium]
MKRVSMRLTRDDAIDAGLAVLALALSFSVLIGLNQRSGIDTSLAWVLAGLHSLPVAMRRRVPRASFAVSMTAGFIYLVVGLPMVCLGLAALLMLYSLAAATPRRESIVGLVVVQLGLVGALAIADSGTQADTMVGNALVLLAMWVIGDSTRRRRQHVLAEQASAAQRAVTDERLRIARELHDIVAHT